MCIYIYIYREREGLVVVREQHGHAARPERLEEAHGPARGILLLVVYVVVDCCFVANHVMMIVLSVLIYCFTVCVYMFGLREASLVRRRSSSLSARTSAR